MIPKLNTTKKKRTPSLTLIQRTERLSPSKILYFSNQIECKKSSRRLANNYYHLVKYWFLECVLNETNKTTFFPNKICNSKHHHFAKHTRLVLSLSLSCFNFEMTFVCDICGFEVQFKFDIIIHLKDHQDGKVKNKIQKKVAGTFWNLYTKFPGNKSLFFHKCIDWILICVKLKLVSMCKHFLCDI